jgi:tetratricopeptide (TPR) repeat protein
MAYNKVENNYDQAVEHYLMAIGLEPGNQRLLYELDLISAAGRANPDTRLELLQSHHESIADNNVSDALSREILLLVQLGRYNEALEVLNANHFKQWEGISKAYNSYVDAHLILGQDLADKGEHAKALDHVRAAGEFPSNMMVAKPYRGGRSCEVLYNTGRVYEAMGRKKQARENYQMCMDERLNQSLDETHFYRALALEKLGRQQEADEIFDGLVSLGRQRLESTRPDFFAKFGERETEEDRRSEAHYLMGLGYLGKKMEDKAREMFTAAVDLNINHLWAGQYLANLTDE